MPGRTPGRPIAYEEGGEVRQLRRLQVAAVAEALTLILLVLVAVPLKHVWGYPMATRVMGPIHGVAFIAYAWCVVATVSGSSGGWSRREVARLAIGAVIPFGGFANAGLLRRKVAAAAGPGNR